MKHYRTIKTEVEETLVIKRSKFICSISRVKDVKEGLEFLKVVKARHPGATHYCYAILSEPSLNEEKLSDDGEPSGTAAAPIKKAITNFNLEGIACVVTRYFGGVKLGASGLTAAYGNSASNALNIADIMDVKWSIISKVVVDYSVIDALNRKLIEESFLIIKTEYEENVSLTIGFPREREKEITSIIDNYTMGKGNLKYIEEKYLIYDKGDKNEN